LVSDVKRTLTEKRVLRRIFGPKRDEIVGGWRKWHDEELHNLHPSPNIVRMIKSGRMIRTGFVARYGREDECKQGFMGNFKEGEH
jgi:hypothetical protein